MRRLAQNYIFSVLETPFCVWDWDIKKRNDDFINGINESYFSYVAGTHDEHLDGPHQQHAAIALRTNYYLALETLFSLIGALLQAPNFVAGWILRIQTSELKEITESLQSQNMKFPIQLKFLNGSASFENVVEMVCSYTKWGADPKDKTKENLTNLLYLLAEDFLNKAFTDEYNSIKHGFRIKSGGFALRAGIEKVPGIAAEEKDMKFVGGSRFGSSYYKVTKIRKTDSQKEPHFVVKRHSVNWLADDTAARTVQAALFIKNLKSLLLVISGAPPNTVEFTRLVDQEAYDSPWERTPGVVSMSFDTIVAPENIKPISKQELLDIIRTKNIG